MFNNMFLQLPLWVAKQPERIWIQIFLDLQLNSSIKVMVCYCCDGFHTRMLFLMTLNTPYTYICASFPLHMLFLCLECSHHHPHFLQPLSDSWSFFRPQLKWCLLSETSPAPAFLIWMTCSLFYGLHISVTVHATVCFILVIVSCEVDRNKVDSSTFMSNMTLHCPSCSVNICWVDGVVKHQDI